MPESNRDAFTRLFNERLGQYTGRTITGAPKVKNEPTPIRNWGDLEKRLGLRKGTLSSNSTARVSDRAKKTIGDELATKLDEDAILKHAREVRENDFVRDVGPNELTLEGATTSVKKGGPIGFLSGLAEEVGSHIPNPLRDIGLRAMDVAARPAYAVAEGLKQAQEEVNKSQDPFTWESLGGALQGLTGEKKTGFGEIVELASQNPDVSWQDYLFGPGLGAFGYEAQWAEDMGHPGLAQNIKRVGGLAGELVGDPLNYVGIGAATKVAGAAKAARGAAAIKSVAREVGEQAVQTLPIKAAGAARDAQIKQILRRIDQAVDETAVEIRKGRTRGRVAGSGRDVVESVAIKGSEAARRAVYTNLDKVTARVRAHVERITSGRTGSLTANQITKMRQGDQVVDNFFNHLEQEVGVNRLLNPATHPNGSLGTASWERFINRADAVARTTYDDVINNFDASLRESLSGNIYKAPTIKVLGKDVVELRSLGRAGNRISERVLSRIEPFSSAMSAPRTFPGVTSLIGQKARSGGIRRFDDMKDAVTSNANTFNLTKDQRRTLQRMLEGTEAVTPQYQDAYNYLRGMYDQIADERASIGLMRPSERVNDFAYVFNKAHWKYKELSKWKSGRRDALRGTRGSRDDFTIAKAKEKGLRPVEDAFDNFMYYYAKHNRDMVAHAFDSDLLRHFGVIAKNASHAQRVGRKMSQVKKSSLADVLTQPLGPGEQFFLPDEIHKIRQSFKRLSTVGGEDAKAFLRLYDSAMRHFKSLSTVYIPGFHFRNLAGDTWMALTDGINADDYLKYFKQIGPNRPDIRIGPKTLTQDDFKLLYDTNVESGGFYASDIPVADAKIQTAGSSLKQVPRKVSDWRENFGRRAHFLAAMKEEYPKALGAANGKEKVAWEQAVKASAYRVNHYRFDYGNLTAFEQGVMKRVFPFYTYSRKALPVLAETLLMNPVQFSRIQRFNNMLAKRAGMEEGEYDSLRMPDWLREIGYAPISGGAEPTVLRQDYLPTNLLQEVSNPLQFGIQSLSPGITLPFELHYGRTAFSGQKVESPAQLLLDKIRPLSVANRAPAFGGGKTWSDWLTQNVFGAPITKVTEGMQQQQMNTLEDDIQTTLYEVNLELADKDVKVYFSRVRGNPTIKVKRVSDDKDLGTFETINDAIDFALQQ